MEKAKCRSLPRLRSTANGEQHLMSAAAAKKRFTPHDGESGGHACIGAKGLRRGCRDCDSEFKRL